jgi:hypothetical protein
MLTKINQARREYVNNVAPSFRINKIDSVIDDINDHLLNNNNVMRGKFYNTLRSDIGEAAASASDDNATSALSKIKSAMDDAMTNSIAAAPRRAGDENILPDARRAYQNYLIVRRAANMAGAGPARGLISPANLHSANKAIMGEEALMNGRGDMTALDRAANTVLMKLPTSGTAENAMWLSELPIAAIIGGEGAYSGGLEGALTHLGVGVAGQSLLANALARRGSPVQGWLGNQTFTGSPNWQSALYASTLANNPPTGQRPRITVTPSNGQ